MAPSNNPFKGGQAPGQDPATPATPKPPMPYGMQGPPAPGQDPGYGGFGKGGELDPNIQRYVDRRLNTPQYHPNYGAPYIQPWMDKNSGVQRPTWDDYEAEKTRVVDYVGKKQAQQLGYTPTFYENPAHVAQMMNAVRNAPSGSDVPAWVDRDQLDIAYKWFEYQNEGKPWTEWKYLSGGDPARQFLQGMGSPPMTFLDPDRQRRFGDASLVRSGQLQWNSLAPDVRASMLADPNFYQTEMQNYPQDQRELIMSDPAFNWDNLPGWQEMVHDVVSNPKVMASPMALAGGNVGRSIGMLFGGAPGGLAGFAGGAAVGYGLGVRGNQEYNPAAGVLEQPTVEAAAMRLLNYLSEGLEQGIGYTSQLITNHDLSLITDDLQRKSAWEAGRITYGYANLGNENLVPFFAGPGEYGLSGGTTEERLASLKENFRNNYGLDNLLFPGPAAIIDRIKQGKAQYAGPGQGFILGQNMPVDKTIGLQELMSLEGVNSGDTEAILDAAREWVVDQVKAGANFQDLALQLVIAEGTTVGGMVGDMALQSIADPLNVAPQLLAKSSGMIATATGHDVFGRAALTADRPAEVMSLYRALVQSGDVPADFSYDGMGAIARLAAGITDDNLIRAGVFSEEALLGVPDVHSPLDKGITNLPKYMATLDPQSRLLAGHNLVQNNLMQMIQHFDGDMDQLKVYYDAIKNNDLETAATMAGKIANSPEWYTALPALKEFDGIDQVLSAWNASEASRLNLLDVARMIGEDDPSIVLKDLRENGADRIMSRLGKIASENAEAAKLLESGFGVDDLNSIKDLFTGDNPLPWHPDQAKAVVSSALQDHFAKWGVDYFGVKRDSITFRLASLGKKFQSALMLGGSPGYAINNQLSNMVFRAGTGNWGYLTPHAMDLFFEDFGYKPFGMGEGVGASGIVISDGSLPKAISLARTGDGTVANLQRVFTAGNKFAPFGALSRWFEGVERKNALAVSMKKIWPRIWEHDKGFRTMDLKLQQKMEGILPGSSDVVYRMIEASMNKQQIEDAIYGRRQVMKSRALVDNAAKAMGVERADAASMLEQIGVFDALDKYLGDANTPEKIDRVFRHVERVAQDNFDLRNAQELEARAEITAESVRQNPTSAGDIFIESEMMRVDRWLDHYLRAGEVAKAIVDTPPEHRNALWSDFYSRSGREMNRSNAAYLANIQGIIRGFGMEGTKGARSLVAAMSDSFQAWDDAYVFMRESRDGYYTKYAGEKDLGKHMEAIDAYADMDDAIDAKFTEARAKEADSMVAIGKIYEDEFTKRFGPEAGAVIADKWGKIIQFREDMWKRLQDFRDRSKTMAPEQMRAAKAEFYTNEYAPMIVEMGHLRSDFGNSAQQAGMGRPTTPPIVPDAGTPPPTGVDTASSIDPTYAGTAQDLFGDKVVERVQQDNLNAAQLESAVWDITRQYENPVHGVMDDGTPNPDAKLHLIKIAKKYGHAEGRAIRTFSDLAAKPELVKRMMEARDQMKKAQLELDMARPATDPAWEEAVVAAKETGVTPDEVVERLREIPSEKMTEAEQVLVTPEPEVNIRAMAAEIIPPEEIRRAKISSDLDVQSMDEFLRYRNALVQPMDDALVLLLEAAEATGEKPQTLLQYIKDAGGINIEYRPDLSGEKKAGKGIPPGLFRKSVDGYGIGLDEMVVRLEEGGYITRGDIDSPMDNGGVNLVTEMIRAAISGDDIYPLDTKVHPEWFQAAGGRDRAIRTVKQVIARVDDPSLKGVQRVKQEAWSYMLDNIDMYPEARQYLEFPFDRSGLYDKEISTLESLVQRMTDEQSYNPDQASDIARDVYRIYPDLPDDASPEYVQRLTAIEDQIQVFHDDWMERQKTLEIEDRAKQSIQAEKARADMIMTRQLLREKFIEKMGISGLEADTAILITDARAKTWADANGHTPEDWYRTRVRDVIAGEIPDLNQDGFQIAKDYIQKATQYELELGGSKPDIAIKRRLDIATYALKDMARSIGYMDDVGIQMYIDAMIREWQYDPIQSNQYHAPREAKNLIRQMVSQSGEVGPVTHVINDLVGVLQEKRWYDAYGKFFDFDDYSQLLKHRQEGMLFQEAQAKGLPVGPMWTYKLQNVIADIGQEKMTGAQLRAAIQKAGVKADELKWSGVQDLLDERGDNGKVTKSEAMEAWTNDHVEVQERILGEEKHPIKGLEEKEGRISEIIDELDLLSDKWDDDNILDGLRREGVVDQSDIDTYFELFLNRLEIELAQLRVDVKKSGGVFETKYPKHVLPGAENYRELLLTLPKNEEGRHAIQGTVFKSGHWDEPNVLAHIRFNERVTVDGKRMLFIEEVQSDWHQAGREDGYVNFNNFGEITETTLTALMKDDMASAKNLYASYGPQGFWKDTEGLHPDWGKDPDASKVWVVTDENGEAVSWNVVGYDQARAGALDYFTKLEDGVPDAPFKKTWHELAMKRALRYAAENGYEQVGWTTGKQQTARYDLRKQVHYIGWEPAGDGLYEITARYLGDDLPKSLGDELTIKEVSRAIGKELANKIEAGEGRKPLSGENLFSDYRDWRIFEGEDLAVGGTGMEGFYDKMLPAWAKKYGKKWGAEVGNQRLSEKNMDSIHTLDVTDAMRESIVSEGQTLFQGPADPKAGISFGEDGRAIIHALSKPDISSVVHELGHIFRRDLSGDDLRITEEWAGVKDGVWKPEVKREAGKYVVDGKIFDDLKDAQAYSSRHEEKFARGFESYLQSGRAPIPQLQKVFFQLKKWLTDIYKEIKGSPIDVEITDDMRGVYDRLLSSNEDWGAYRAGKQAQAHMDTLSDRSPADGLSGGRQYPDSPNRAGDYYYGEDGKAVGFIQYDDAGINSLYVTDAALDPMTVAQEMIVAVSKSVDIDPKKLWDDVARLVHSDLEDLQIFDLDLDVEAVARISQELPDIEAVKQQQGEWVRQGDQIAPLETVTPETVTPEIDQPIGIPPEAEALAIKMDKPKPRAEFGKPPGKPKNDQLGLFGQAEDTPLFSGTTQKAQLEVFKKKQTVKQQTLVDETPQMKGVRPGGDAVDAGPLLSVKNTGLLEDFGEKLGGSRRDQEATMYRDIPDGDIAKMKLSEIWPLKELDLIDDVPMAALATALRSSIPSKPRASYKVQRWAGKVTLIRSLLDYAGKNGVAPTMDRMNAPIYKSLGRLVNKVDLLQQLPREHWNRVGDVHDFQFAYKFVDGEKVNSPYSYTTVDGVRIDSTNLADLVQAVADKLGDAKQAQKMKFEIRGNKNVVYINKVGDPLYRRLKTFNSTQEARAFIRNNYNDLSAAWDDVKLRDNIKETDVRRQHNAPRTGIDYRQGVDVTPEMYMETFGFRGVEFGNWVKQGVGTRERMWMLNSAYDSFMDMADILGVPPKALSLDGELGLGFGSRGRGGKAAAHYEVSHVVINLTKTKGAGSLAHEWFHALDNFFNKKREITPIDQHFITQSPETVYRHADNGQTLSKSRFDNLVERGQDVGRSLIKDPDKWEIVEGVRPEVEEKFYALVKALDESPMRKRAKLLDKGRKVYWSDVLERAARSFENYIIHKLMLEGHDNDYLANVSTVEQFGALGKSLDRYPYLLDAEMAPVADAFDDLFSTLETRETSTGIELYQDATPARTPGFERWFGESKAVDSNGDPLVLYHGTNADVNKFGGADQYFFTPSKESAGYYGDTQMPVYLRLENPLELDYHGMPDNDVVFDIEEAVDGGYDGVIIRNTMDGYTDLDQYVVFDPNQVKSVENQGTFSLTDDRILYQDTDPARPFGAYENAAGFIPEGYAMDEGWSQFVKPLLDNMKDEAKAQVDNRPFTLTELDPETQTQLRTYVNQVKSDMTSAKRAAVTHGEQMTNFALLDYDRRTGLDNMLDVGIPYQFFYTHTLMNSAFRVLDRPAWYSNMARWNMFANKQENNLPERLRGKIKVPSPWLPEWMGGNMYIDPMRVVFPMETFTQPFENVTRDRGYQVVSAERILQEWSDSSSYGAGEIKKALDTHDGRLWTMAMEEAELRRGEIKDSPLDLLSTMFGPAYYLKNPWYDLTGGSGQYLADSTLPLTNTARAIETVTQDTWAEPLGKIAGLFGKPESWLREKTGKGEYGDKDLSDYYVKRQVANLVADGEATIDQAQLALAEQSGPVWEAAQERVRLEMALRVPLASAAYAGLHGGLAEAARALPSSLFSSGILPEGELKYRGLNEKWGAALDARGRGDDGAVSQFFDDHPEYEVYLSKNKPAEEQLRGYLVSAIWDGYMGMQKDNRRVVSGQLGPEFERYFLNKETRDPTSIDVATLATWARYVGSQVPKTEATASVTDIPDSQFPQPQGIPTDITGELSNYNAWKESQFPNINTIQSMYFETPKDERHKIVAMFPELRDYWTKRREYLNSNPAVSQFIDQSHAESILAGEADPIGMDQDQARSLLTNYRSPEYAAPIFTADYYLADATPILIEQLTLFVLTGTPVSGGGMSELERIWSSNGKPGDSMDSFMNDILIPTFGY